MRALAVYYLVDGSDANDRNNLNNNARFVRITQALRAIKMGSSGLYAEICSYINLELAFKMARKGKTQKEYVIEFEKNLKENLLQLRAELLFHIYKPEPLKTFILKDPKTRRISKANFRDRVVHHALFNIIEPIFDRRFIYDSYANRKGKGALKAIERFDSFKRKVSKNNTSSCFVLKADIKHYFDEVNHEILINIIRKKVNDGGAIWLITRILSNYSLEQNGKSMPLGNLTSQFFANVYLNELDQFVKHKLRAKYYIRYVDDFVILEYDKEKLEFYKEQIDEFLKNKLKLQLHKDKSQIHKLGESINFLGFRVFYHHKLLKKSNLRKMNNSIHLLQEGYRNGLVDYDDIYDFIEGWIAYANNGNTYKLRKKILADFEREFSGEISTKEINRCLKMQKK